MIFGKEPFLRVFIATDRSVLQRLKRTQRKPSQRGVSGRFSGLYDLRGNGVIYFAENIE
jgi:hypothetical protein